MTIRYARSGSAHIAYDTVGGGPIDLLHIASGVMVPIDVVDEEPRIARYFRRLASFARVIFFDPRGIGRSDPLDPQFPNTAASAAEDALAVLDAANSAAAVIVGWFGGGPIGIELAAAHPARVSSLVLLNTYARLIDDDDYPLGIPKEQVEEFLRQNPDPDTPWTIDGTDDIALLAPSMANDVRFRDWMVHSAARAASPATALIHNTMISHADVRELLPGISVPTLVLHRERNRFVSRRFGRYLAEHVEGARFVTVPGADHLPWTGDADTLLDEIEEFLTGQRHGSADRVLTTVLFTDIVGSTAHAGRLGDEAWRRELDTHDSIVRAQLGRLGGREVNTTGDGFLASFDTPTAAVRAALAILDATSAAGFILRAGVHIGECERRGADLAGMAVHITARVCARAEPGEVLVSRTVCDVMTGSGLVLESRGHFELKGLPQPWELFAVRP
jgi:class 3 adenylate cyclase